MATESDISSNVDLTTHVVVPQSKLVGIDEGLEEFSRSNPAHKLKFATPVIDLTTKDVVQQLGDGTEASPKLPFVLGGSNELAMDAWGRQKIVQDHSLFSGLWTFNVPNRQWLEFTQPVATPEDGFTESQIIPKDNSSVYSKSTNGMLEVSNLATHNTMLLSKQHLRYQPNRGYLYSTAVILPGPSIIGIRRFGLLNEQSGMFFELEGLGTIWKLSVVRRTTVDGETIDHKADITDRLPQGFDISKGHVFDIQAQWRGVGNIKFFVDLQLIHTANLLGTLTAMSVNNPAMTIGWYCAGPNSIKILAGCVDVSSEGGHHTNKLYTSATTGSELVAATRTGNKAVALLAIRIPKTITYNGEEMLYTRDMVLSALTSFCRDEHTSSMWVGRGINTPNLNALTWSEKPDSYWEYIAEVNGSSALNVAFQADISADADCLDNMFTSKQERDFGDRINFAADPSVSVFFTPGDIIVFAVRPDQSGQLAGITAEFAEEV